MSEHPVAYHVYPTFGRSHDTDGGACWCRAYTERVAGGAVIIHNDDVGAALNLHPKYLAEWAPD